MFPLLTLPAQQPVAALHWLKLWTRLVSFERLPWLLLQRNMGCYAFDTGLPTADTRHLVDLLAPVLLVLTCEVLDGFLLLPLLLLVGRLLLTMPDRLGSSGNKG